MHRIPDEASDETINQLFEGELATSKATAAALDRLEQIMHEPPTSVPELMFHTNKRHNYEFVKVPLGCDIGWGCYDPNRCDGLSDEHRVIGYGKTQDEAYIDLLNQLEDEAPKPRGGMIVHSSPFEPPTVVDTLYQDPDEE